MLLGFKRRFAPMVEDGSKTHTIRSQRAIAPKVGEICHCYVDPRQKTMRLLGRWPCVKVEEILIYECADGRFSVVIEGEELTPDEKDALAWRDGFRDTDSDDSPFVQMMRYWMKTHGDGRQVEVSYVNFPQFPHGEPFLVGHGKLLAFKGHLIHWKYSGGKS